MQAEQGGSEWGGEHRRRMEEPRASACSPKLKSGSQALAGCSAGCVLEAESRRGKMENGRHHPLLLPAPTYPRCLGKMCQVNDARARLVWSLRRLAGWLVLAWRWSHGCWKMGKWCSTCHGEDSPWVLSAWYSYQVVYREFSRKQSILDAVKLFFVALFVFGVFPV